MTQNKRKLYDSLLCPSNCMLKIHRGKSKKKKYTGKLPLDFLLKKLELAKKSNKRVEIEIFIVWNNNFLVTTNLTVWTRTLCW